jgi:hypothetical protein
MLRVHLNRTTRASLETHLKTFPASLHASICAAGLYYEEMRDARHLELNVSERVVFEAATIALPRVEALGSLKLSLSKSESDAVSASRMFARLVPELTALKALDLGCYESLVDEDLIHLSGLTNLRFLELDRSGNSLTGLRLKHLAGLTGIQLLSLDGNDDLKVGGLKALGSMINLMYLSLADCTSLDGRSLRIIGRSTSLRSLDLSGTILADRYFKHLTRLTDLRELNICRCHGLTGVGLKHLIALTSLSIRWLGCEDITLPGRLIILEFNSRPCGRCQKTRDICECI